MAEIRPHSSSKSKPAPPASAGSGDRFPTNEELLHELRRHGAKPPPPREIPAVSRRTRDFLLLAGIGSVGIVAFALRVLHDSDGFVIARLAFTGVALLCGLLWFIFYGVMSRY